MRLVCRVTPPCRQINDGKMGDINVQLHNETWCYILSVRLPRLVFVAFKLLALPLCRRLYRFFFIQANRWVQVDA